MKLLGNRLRFFSGVLAVLFCANTVLARDLTEGEKAELLRVLRKGSEIEKAIKIDEFIELAPGDLDFHYALAERLLTDPSAALRAKAAWTLGDLGVHDSETLQALVQALGDDDEWVRIQAVWALGRTQSQEPDIHDALAQRLYDAHPLVRGESARALGRLRATDVEIHKMLAESLKDQHPTVRREAARALGDIRTQDPEIQKALAYALKDSDRWVQSGAQDALFASLTQKSFETSDPIHAAHVALMMTTAGGEWDPDHLDFDRSDLYAAWELLQESKALFLDTSIQKDLMRGVAQIEEKLLDSTLERLRSSDAALRHRAANALSEFPPRFEQVIARLKKERRNPDPFVRERAKKILELSGARPSFLRRVWNTCVLLLSSPKS